MKISQELINTLQSELERLESLTKKLLDSIKTKTLAIKSSIKEQQYEQVIQERKQRPERKEQTEEVEKVSGINAGREESITTTSPNITGGSRNKINAGGKRKLEQRAVSKEVTPEGRALLDAIAVKESRGRYDLIVGEGSEKGLNEIDRAANKSKGYDKAPTTFSDYSKHPGIRGMRTERGYSTAAGRYQFLESTWNQLASRYPDLTDFSPKNQDKAAWYLAQEEYLRDTGRDLQKDLESKDPKLLANIESSLKNQWTSLTGGVEQGKGQSNEAFNQAYNESLEVQKQQTQTAATSADAEKIEPAKEESSLIEKNNQANVEPTDNTSLNERAQQLAQQAKPKRKTITNNIIQPMLIAQSSKTVSDSDTTVSTSLPSPDDLKQQYMNLA